MTATNHKPEPQPVRRFKEAVTRGTHMNKLVPLCCGLLLVLAGSLCAAETELIDTNTPWRTYLVTGPTVRWQNGG